MGVLLIWAVGLLLSISLLPHLNSSFWYSEDLGELSTPENIELFFVGENMTVFCQKYSDFTGKASFKLGNDDYLPEEFVKQLNTTHAELVRPVSPGDPESFVVQCFDNGISSLISSLTLRTDYAPGSAQNLNVQWIDMKSLHFRFDFGGIPYKNNRSVVNNITAEYSSNNSAGWLPCPNVGLDTLTCSIDSFTPFMETMFYVRVNATNSLRGKTNSTILGDKAMKEYAKSSPVLVKEAVPLNSSSIKLLVSFEVSSDRDRSSYIITYYKDTQSEPVNKTELETGQTSDKIFTITQLHPAYTYRFEVRAKFDTGNPSDLGPKSVINVTMPEDAPAAGPQIHPSAFFLQQNPCVGQSAVYIYYQAVADEYKNGEIRNYTATLSTVSLQTFVQSRSDSHTLKLENVPCNESLEVKVQAANNAGTSPHTSIILPSYSSVKPLLQKVTECDLKIRYDAGSVTALWNLRSDQKHVVYYCQRFGIDPAQCQGNIHFIEIEPGENISQMLLPNAKVDMKFGMAVLSPKPSGILFTECIYDTSNKLPNLGDAKLQAISQDNYITLKWSWQRCDSSRRTMILEYQLEICLMPGTKDCSTYIVDGHATEYKVENAVRNTNYSVRIRANTTSTDIWTPYSDFVYTSLPSTPGLAGLNGGEIAGIVIAVLMAALFLGSTLACILRFKYKQKIIQFGPTIFNTSDFNSSSDNKDEKYAEVNNDQSSPSATDTISTKDSAKFLSLDSVFCQLSSADEKDADSIVEPAKPSLPQHYSRVMADHFAPAAGTKHINVNVAIIISHAQPSDCNALANGVPMAAAAPDSAKSLVMESSSTASCLQDMSTSVDKDTDASNSASNDHALPGYMQVTKSSLKSDSGSSSSTSEEVHGELPIYRYISNLRCYSPESNSTESTEEKAEISSSGCVEDASMDSVPEEPEQKSQHPVQPAGYVTYDKVMHLHDTYSPDPSLDRFARDNAEPAIEPLLDKDQYSSQSVPNQLIPTSGGYVSYPLTTPAMVPSAAVYLEKGSLPGSPYHEAKASFRETNFVAELSEKHQEADSGLVNPVTGYSDSAASHGFVPLQEAALENVGHVGPTPNAEHDVDQHSLCSSKSNDSSAGISLGSFAGVETCSDAGSNQDPGDHNIDPITLDRQDSGYISPHPASESPWDPVRLQTLTAASYPTYSLAATPTEDTRAGNSGGYIAFNDLPPSISHTLGDS